MACIMGILIIQATAHANRTKKKRGQKRRRLWRFDGSCGNGFHDFSEIIRTHGRRSLQVTERFWSLSWPRCQCFCGLRWERVYWVGLLVAQIVCAAVVVVVVLVTTDWNVRAERARELTRVNVENNQASHHDDDETTTNDENLDDHDIEAGLVPVVL